MTEINPQAREDIFHQEEFDSPEFETPKDVFTLFRLLAKISNTEDDRLSHKAIRVETILGLIYRSLHETTQTRTESVLNSEVLDREVGSGGLDYESARWALRTVVFPGTQIPLFIGGGGFLVFDMTGIPRSWDEDRAGHVYDIVKNSAPYTAMKPACMFALRQQGREMDLLNQENSDWVCDTLKNKRGSMHLGAITGQLPLGPNGEKIPVVMGVTSTEVTDEAFTHLMTKIDARFHDPFPEDEANKRLYPQGLFTVAGYLDDLAAKVVMGHLNGLSIEALQEIVNDDIKILLAMDPIPPQCN